jgi:hypothetical protein
VRAARGNVRVGRAATNADLFGARAGVEVGGQGLPKNPVLPAGTAIVCAPGGTNRRVC